MDGTERGEEVRKWEGRRENEQEKGTRSALGKMGQLGHTR